VMYNEATHNKRNACTEKQSHWYGFRHIDALISKFIPTY
jgi:hypothetical protein